MDDVFWVGYLWAKIPPPIIAELEGLLRHACFFLFGDFDMQNPWDRPPLPPMGNANPDDIYCGVGRVLSQWELVELQIGYLGTAFAMRHYDHNALLEYGEGSTFKGRISVLERVMEKFFIGLCDQKLEGNLSSLLERTRKFADRRHDVAHAVVRDQTWAQWITPGSKPPSAPKGYFLLPTHYKGNRYSPSSGLPAYAYNSSLLGEFAYNLGLLASEVQGIGHRVTEMVSSPSA